MKKNYSIAIDFDGTCVTHEFPQIGKDIGAVPVLKKLTDNGHKLILFTMRSDMQDVVSDDAEIFGESGNHLTEAINWFKENNIPLYGIQRNPTQHQWTHSPKCYANMYIDDAGIGTPLKFDPTICGRPYVNWTEVEKMLQDLRLI